MCFLKQSNLQFPLVIPRVELICIENVWSNPDVLLYGFIICAYYYYTTRYILNLYFWKIPEVSLREQWNFHKCSAAPKISLWLFPWWALFLLYFYQSIWVLYPFLFYINIPIFCYLRGFLMVAVEPLVFLSFTWQRFLNLQFLCFCSCLNVCDNTMETSCNQS